MGPPTTPFRPQHHLAWPVSQQQISDRLGRHALCKQIIEKITPEWDSCTVDLLCVMSSSGFLLQIEEWLPTLNLVATFNLPTHHTDQRWLLGHLGALDVTAAAAMESLPFPSRSPLFSPSLCLSQPLLLSFSLPSPLISVLG